MAQGDVQKINDVEYRGPDGDAFKPSDYPGWGELDDGYTSWMDKARKDALDALARNKQGLAATTAGLQGRATQLGQEFDAKKQADIGNVRRQAAQSLSAVQGSGSGYGMLQAGMNSGQAIASTSANDDAAKTAAVNQALDAANQARQQQDAFDITASEKAKSIGTAQNDIDAEMMKADAYLDKLKASKEYYGFWKNDTAGAFNDIKAWARANLHTPQARMYANQLATDVGNGSKKLG